VKHLKGTNSVRAAAVHCLACLLQENPANCKWVVLMFVVPLSMLLLWLGCVQRLMGSRHWWPCSQTPRLCAAILQQSALSACHVMVRLPVSL
jgi:hypothetical protein